MTQKGLKSLYMDIICSDVWQSKTMQEYARKNCAYVIQLSNGNIICIEKPEIKTSFCFGMGAYANYTDEEEKRANDLAEKAATEETYFKEENLKDFNNRISKLQQCLSSDQYECYTYNAYTGESDDCKLKTYAVVHLFDNPDYNKIKWDRLQAVTKINSDDIQAIIDGLEEAKRMFNKRLDTYLKRYGLSKLHIWTYVRD